MTSVGHLEDAAGQAGHRLRVAVLLGAGASGDAGLPMTGELTQRLVARLGGQSPAGRALNYVCSALIGHRGASGGDPYAALDVERVFTAVQLLATRADHEVAPFVNAWHPGVEAFDSGGGFNAELTLQRSLDMALGGGAGGASALQKDIASIARAAVGSGGDGRVYVQLQKRMLSALCHELDLPPGADVGYLCPLAELAAGPGGLDVATLNYDLTVERSCAGRSTVSTGVSTEPSAKAWHWPTTGLRLLKLHGSIDWRYETSPYQQHHQGFLPQRLLLTGVDPATNDSPAVVFGERGKVRAGAPSLVSSATLRTCSRKRTGL